LELCRWAQRQHHPLVLCERVEKRAADATHDARFIYLCVVEMDDGLVPATWAIPPFINHLTVAGRLVLLRSDLAPESSLTSAQIRST
jgi:hypothetical protein